MADLYQQADPDARRKLIVYLLIGAVIGAGAIYYYSELLADAIDDPELAFERLALIVNSLYVLVVPAIWFAVRIWRIARLTSEAECYPPPGVAVVRDTRIVTGGDALRRAFAIRLVAALVVATSVLLPTVLMMLVSAFEQRLEAH